MGNVVFAPGLHNSGPRHWQSHWQLRLPQSVRAEQARWDEPDLEAWSETVAAAVRKAGPSWIVAHSFGCLASVHALAEVGDLVEGLFLVAPADPHKFGVAEQLPQEGLGVPGALVGSLTDPWLSWERAQSWAARWQLSALYAGAAGHINVASGHGCWSEGWSWFERVRRGEAQIEPPRRWLALAV